ncbi:MAG: arginine--tRNA ligase [Candidatus Helarchaeota archaeon]
MTNPIEELIKQIEDIIKKFLEDKGILEYISDFGIKESPQTKFGDYNTAICFRIAKILKEQPRNIAEMLIDSINLRNYNLIKEVKNENGYVNFFINYTEFNFLVLKTINEMGSNYGRLENIDKDKKILIEHTSVNPNKPWHVGHARNAILGDTIARLYKKAGYNIEVQNYIDDTGKQVADTLFAMDYFGFDGLPNDKRIDHWMGKIYVDIYKLMDELQSKIKKSKELGEKTTNYEDKLNEIINGIENKIKLVEKGIYRNIVEKCVKDQLKTAFKLRIFYDLLSWESDIVRAGLFNESLNIIKKSKYVQYVEEGKLKGCLTILIDKYLEDNPNDKETRKLFYGMSEPNKVLLRSDGTSTYVAKDIAYQMWKFGLLKKNMKYKLFINQPNGQQLWTTAPDGETNDKFGHADKIINVIGMEQMYEQSCVAISLKIMDFNEYYKNSYHLGYAHVKLKEGRMSGRKGIWTATDDIINEAILRAKNEIKKRRIDFPEDKLEKTAESIGISAIRYALINQNPTKEIIFDWDTVLNFDGDAAPYLQYAYARTAGILREAKKRNISFSKKNLKTVSKLITHEELILIKNLGLYPQIIENCIINYDPSILTQFTYNLTQIFSRFYTKCPILPTKDIELREARLILVESFQTVLKSIFDVLGIDILEKM